MTQPNQHSFTRSQIRQLARSGGLTPEVVAKIDAAAKKGQIIDDVAKMRGTIPRRPAEPAAEPEASATSTAMRGGNELGGVMTTNEPKLGWPSW